MIHLTSKVKHCTRQRLPAKPAGLTLLVLVLCYFTGLNVLTAAKPSLPDAAVILDKYIEVTGGKAAYEKVYNRVSKSRLVFVGMGVESAVATYSAKPNKSYTKIESDVMGNAEYGTDGNITWYLSGSTGPLIEEGKAREAFLRSATFNSVLYWRKLYKKAECVGEEVINGKKCFKIVMKPSEDNPETFYYDRESNLLVKIKKTRLSSHMGSMPIEMFLSDYKRVDNILIPHKIKQVFKQCGNTRELLFVAEKIEHNVKIAGDIFNPPEEIQSLAKKGAAHGPGRKPQQGSCEKKSGK